ncbi:hypothetical protein SUGI_0333110 [Cryptomeria japonica]|nr:hypothetical protein SUGI_0333110 [Cryptomeria japonica]
MYVVALIQQLRCEFQFMFLPSKVLEVGQHFAKFVFMFQSSKVYRGMQGSKINGGNRSNGCAESSYR